MNLPRLSTRHPISSVDSRMLNNRFNLTSFSVSDISYIFEIQGGRPKGVPAKAEATAYAAAALYQEGVLSVQQIADRLGIAH